MLLFRKFSLRNILYGSVSLLLIFLGFLVGWELGQYRIKENLSLQTVRQQNAAYKYIDPLLACNYAPQAIFTELNAMKQKVQSFIRSQENLDVVSMYYRDIQSGRWAGIGENAGYNPASLLKVPIMIAYLKQSESDPSLLSRKFYYSGDVYKKDNLAPSSSATDKESHV